MSAVNVIPECAACGKQGGESNLKACTACKLVKYCNVTCQKSHRPKHKKECKKRAAALFDEALFKPPPPREDCPICFLRLPCTSETVYKSCCGKLLCTGCVHEMARETDICPFCRIPASVPDEKLVDRCRKRMEAGDANAFLELGSRYLAGVWGLPQDHKKGLELLLRAVELGSTDAHFMIGCIYVKGEFTEKDPIKGLYHYQRAAMGGCELARYNLGCQEQERGNTERAMKHWMIAAASGYENSLEVVRKEFLLGHVTKSDYENTLRAHQKYLSEVKSDQRDRAVGVFG
ncbi:hypothetical protein ACHAXR_011226 [Thalassiosira sp. AJA248-18]